MNAVTPDELTQALLAYDLARKMALTHVVYHSVFRAEQFKDVTGDQPHIAFPVKLKEVKDKGAVSAQLEDWAELPNLQRVIISHGDIIAKAPGAVLKRISLELRA